MKIMIFPLVIAFVAGWIFGSLLNLISSMRQWKQLDFLIEKRIKENELLHERSHVHPKNHES